MSRQVAGSLVGRAWQLALSLFTLFSNFALFFFKLLFVGGARRRKVARLQEHLKKASDYETWKAIGLEIDRLSGRDSWKKNPVSVDFDYALIERRLKQLRQMRETEDIWSMVFLLRAGLSRNLGGIGNPKLFSHAVVGTKEIIEEYINELGLCLEAIEQHSSEEIPIKAKIEFFSGLRQVFGCSALLLSGGSTLGLYHLGVVKALFEKGLLPRIFASSSGGAVLASLICTRTDDELPLIFDPHNINLDPIQRRGSSGAAKRRLSRLLERGYLFDIEVLQECLRANIGDLTFQEAYNKTRRILNIMVSSNSIHEQPRLLNYLTAPNVLIWSAASASCAIPGLFQQVPLMAKSKEGTILPWNAAGGTWIDGSLENDLPLARLAEQFNVNHFILSQAHPHVVPFLSREAPVQGTFFSKFRYLIASEISHRVVQIIELGIFPAFLQRMFLWTRLQFSQQYQGDITIAPPVPPTVYLSVMSNPDQDELLERIKISERATWEKFSILEMHCNTEKTIDSILYRLRLSLLEKQGKIYRPVDFALSLTALDDDDADAQMGKRSQSLGSNLAGTAIPRGVGGL